jgi:hypothetical protein
VTDNLLPPVRGDVRFTDPFFGPRGDHKHLGTDFGPQTRHVPGDDVVASASGRIVYRYKSSTYGNAAIVERDNGDGTYSYFLYAHLADPPKPISSNPTTPPAVGDENKAGEVIGQMGNTGSSAKGEKIPVHTHFEQITTGDRLDFSNGWPLGKGNVGVTENGIPWERVGSSFQLPNGWVATSDNGRIGVTIPAERLFGAQPPANGVLPAPPKESDDGALPPAPDQPDSFSNRFGSWGSASAGPFGEIRSAPRPQAPSGRAAPPLPPLPNDLPGTSANWQSHFGQFPDNYVPTVPDQNASVPWYSSPALEGNFAPANRSGDTPSPVPRALEKNRSAAPDLDRDANRSPPTPASDNFRRLSRRTNGQSSPSASDASALTVPFNPSADANSAGGPLGIVSGQPMPQRAPQPPLADLFGITKASGGSDWSNLLAGLVSPNPTQPEQAPQTADNDAPERRLSRRIPNQPPMPAFDPGALAAPLAPSVDPDLSGGVLGRYAAMRIDPKILMQPAPSPDDEDEQANMRALEARLSSSGNIRDALALYNARRSKWG